MNRHLDGQKLDGQTKINLHNNVNRPAAMNDYLSYGASREYGVAASRTGWADVSLNGASLGRDALVEQVNSAALWAEDPGRSPARDDKALMPSRHREVTFVTGMFLCTVSPQ